MDTDYADDMAVIDNTEGRLQESIDLTLTTALMLGWRTPKRQCMVVSKCASQRPYTERYTIELTAEGAPVE